MPVYLKGTNSCGCRWVTRFGVVIAEPCQPSHGGRLERQLEPIVKAAGLAMEIRQRPPTLGEAIAAVAEQWRSVGRALRRESLELAEEIRRFARAVRRIDGKKED